MKMGTWGSACLCMVLLAACGPDVRIQLVPDQSITSPVSPQHQSNAHAVFTHDIGWVHFTPPGVMSHPEILHAFTHVVELKLLTRTATEKYGTILIQHLGDLLRLEASVTKSSGEKTTLSPSDIKKTTTLRNALPSTSQPLDLYETALIFPGLEAGDVLSYQYTRRGHADSWNFSRTDAPVLFSRFIYPRPSWNSILKFVVHNPNQLPVEKIRKTFVDSKVFSSKGAFQSFTMRNVPAVVTAPNMILTSDLMTNLRVFMVMTGKNMNSLARVYFKWITRGKTAPYGFDKIAKDMVGDTEEPKEIAKRIHDWIKTNIAISDPKKLSLRYPYSEQLNLALGGILKDKQASAERAAALAWALVSSLGEMTKVVLTTHRDFLEADPKIVTLEQFSHVFLSLEDGTLIDTSDRYVPFGKIPMEFEGRKAMWADGKKGDWRVLERSTALQNVAKRKIVAKVQIDGDLVVKENWSLSGNKALELRRKFGPLTEKQREKLMSDLLHAMAPGAMLESFKVENLDTNLEKALSFTFEYRLPGGMKSSGSKMFISLNSFDRTAFPELDGNAQPHPLRFPYAWKNEAETTFVLPTSLRISQRPQFCKQSNELKEAGFETRTSCSKDGDEHFTIRRTLIQGKHRVEAKHFQQMKALTDEYRSFSATRLVLEK